MKIYNFFLVEKSSYVLGHHVLNIMRLCGLEAHKKEFEQEGGKEDVRKSVTMLPKNVSIWRGLVYNS